jgi:hypothetical protein
MKNTLVIFLVYLCVVVGSLAGCASMHIKDLRPEMSKAQVEELLGRPDEYLVTGFAETYTYNFYMGDSYNLLFWKDQLRSWRTTYIDRGRGYGSVGVVAPINPPRY